MRKIIVFAAVTLFSIQFQFAQNVQGVLLSDTGNISVVKVWGTHSERGFATGYLLGEKIKSIYTGYIMPAFGSYLATAKTIIQQSQHLKIDPAYMEEAKAIVNGMSFAGIDVTGFDSLDVLVANSFLDLQNLSYFQNLQLDNGCSSLMSWGEATNGTALDGKSVIARHLDWSTNASIINNQAMVIHIPSEEDEQPWLLIGFAGQISALSGVNSSGLSAFQHMLSDFSGSGTLNKAYEPIWFSLRKALEKKDFNNDDQQNVLDIKDVLLQNPNGYADGYIVTALGSSEAIEDSLIALVAELAPNLPRFTFRGNEYTDNLPGDNLYAANNSIKRNDAHNYCSRYNAVVTGVEDGKLIGEEENWEIMKTRSNSGSGNIQFMQFIPELNKLNLSVYKNAIPAYLNEPMSYDLSLLFSQINSDNLTSCDKSEPFNIYNKTSDTYIFEINDPKYIPAIFSVYDIAGRKIQSITSEKALLEADLSIFAKGIYIVTMKSKGLPALSKKIIR